MHFFMVLNWEWGGVVSGGNNNKFKSRLYAFRNEAAVSALAIAIGLGAVLKIHAQEIKQTIKQAEATPAATVPEIVVTAPKPKRKVARTQPAAGASTATAANEASTATGTGTGGNALTQPLEQIPQVGKTGTEIKNLPISVTYIPKQIVTQEGGTTVRDAIRNSSGISQGGPSSYGFFDRFLIRGLDARIYNDGLPDFDQINGLPHSLNGVDHLEILKGPGSALFGSGPPGGVINIVHSLPQAVPLYGISTQIGSFATVTTNLFATGATAIPYLNYRVDALIQHTDGFRGLKGANYEVRPQFTYTWDHHVTNMSLDVRHIEATPDPAGIPYFRPGSVGIAFPLTAVPSDTKYSSPYDHGNQDYVRGTITDSWWINNILTINQSLTYAHRDLDILRNGDGGAVAFDVPSGQYQLTGRTMRHQHDLDDDMDYQFEPLWKFNTGSVGHTLLTGFELHDQYIITHRETAPACNATAKPPITTGCLNNIANIFAPVVPDLSPNGLGFVPNFKDNMRATYIGLYATDQIDVTEQFKLRLGARQDFWQTNLTPEVTIPGRKDSAGNPLLGGVTYSRQDMPVSWNAGALYHILPGVSPYAGVATSHMANFNSEADQNGLNAPENAIQYEAGIKLEAPQGRATLTAAWFDTERSNVQSSLAQANGNTLVVFNSQLTRGYETDIVLQPTDKWKIFANATWQRAYLTDNPSAPAATGLQPQGVPRRLLNIFTTYDFKIANIDGFRVGGGMQGRDRIYADALNTMAVPGWVVFDALFGYYQPKWDAQIGVKNITNREYFLTANGVGGFVGDPRTYYVKASARF